MVLYLSYDGLTDPLGRSQVLPYLQGLAKASSIWIVSCEKSDQFALHRNEVDVLCKKAGIFWYPLNYSKRPPVLSTVYDLQRMYSLAARLHRENAFRLVHARSYPAGLVGLRLKRTMGIPFLFDMRGFWVDERVDGGIWNTMNPLYAMIYRWFKRKEKEMLAEAAEIVSLTYAAVPVIMEILTSQPAASTTRITVIPCMADLTFFDRGQISHLTSALREKLAIPPGSKVLGYQGSLATWYLPNDLLRVWKALLQADNKLHLLLVTRDRVDGLLRAAETEGLPVEQLKITSAQRSEMPVLLGIMDVGLCLIKQAPSKRASSPVKLGEYLAMGVPVIANDIGDVAQQVHSHGCGILIDPSKPEDMASLTEKWNHLLQIPPEKCRKAAELLFSLDRGIAAYAEIYKRLLARHTVSD